MSLAVTMGLEVNSQKRRNEMSASQRSEQIKAETEVKVQALQERAAKAQGGAMIIKSVDPHDSRAVRNLENVIAWNEMMINQKRPKEAIEKYTRPDYIQHNPLLVDGPSGIIHYFTQVTTEHKNARLVYHRAIAAGDYVYTHGVFYNFIDDNPDDHGMAVVDIFRMDDEGKAAEHWDVLQLVGDPKSNVAPSFGPAVFGKPVPAQNPNGMVEGTDES
jgi:predicted SnoaL-like aldol condensation-catalyzing enzyme